MAAPWGQTLDEETKSTGGGYSHTGNIQAFFGLKIGTSDTYCYFFRATNRSTPGADRSSVSGKIFTSNLGSDPNYEKQINKQCSQPCIGATWQSDYLELSVTDIWSRAYKIHIEGTHAFSVGTSGVEVKTAAEGAANAAPFGGG